MALQLVIGNPNYSSWSLRPWLILKHHNIAFDQIVVPFNPADTLSERIARYSPTRKVPVLRDGDFIVWETIAIAEYLAERFPETNLWPAALSPRTHARAVSAEMHAGFARLREHMTLNCRRRLPGRGRALGRGRGYCARVRNLARLSRALWQRGRIFIRRIHDRRRYVRAGGVAVRDLRSLA